MELGALTKDESVQLLLRRHKNTATKDHIEEAKKIVERLGRHPLAILQASSYISATGTPIGSYLEAFDRQREILLNSGILFGYQRQQGSEDRDKTLTSSTLEVSSLSGDSKSAEQAARLATISSSTWLPHDSHVERNNIDKKVDGNDAEDDTGTYWGEHELSSQVEDANASGDTNVKQEEDDIEDVQVIKLNRAGSWVAEDMASLVTVRQDLSLFQDADDDGDEYGMRPLLNPFI